MRICNGFTEAPKGWALEDFQPGDVLETKRGFAVVLDTNLAAVKWDVYSTFTGHIPTQRLVSKDGGGNFPAVWFRPSEILARYPNACIKLGEPEKR